MAASEASSLIAKSEEFLKSKSIKYTLYNHVAVPTAEEHIKVAASGSFTGSCAKNLFFKDKKGKYFLVVIPAEKQVNLKALAKLIGASGDIRFAQNDVLQSLLGVKTGSVTPLGVPLFDTKKEISVVLDSKLEKSTLLIHPLINEASISIAATDLATLITTHGNEYRVLDFTSVETGGAAGGEKKEAEKKPAAANKTDKKPAAAASKTDDKDKNTMGIEYPKTTRTFANWYQQVVLRSEMIEFYDISGCYILRPWSFSIWESIQSWFDGEIKKLGVKNSYFPLFVSSKALTKEKDHVEGFAAEVAWVTRSGETELDEPIAVRPTSETIMYPAFAKWIRSHRDLPLKLNQWSNVVRWEFKYPTPFIRSREFLWQEGHTAFATQAEADKEVLDILNLYAGVYQELLAVPVIKGKKTETEKFAGGYYTTTVEAFIPAVGRGVQGATSHCLGQNFAKMFDITFEDEDHNKKHAIQNSWGLTTRTIGVMVMVHGDDKGLVLPPRVAPIQAVLIPIIFSEAKVDVVKPAEELFKQLKAVGIRIHLDDREKNPGWKYSDWELRGVPVRLELGPKDAEKKQVTAVRRDNKAKIELAWSTIDTTLPELLRTIQAEMLQRATDEMLSRQIKTTDWNEMNKALDKRCTTLVPHCAVATCEKDIKKRTGEAKIEEEEAEHEEEGGEKLTGAAKSLCIPFEQPELIKGTKCIGCGQDAVNWTLFGRSY